MDIHKIIGKNGTVEFRIGGPTGKLHNTHGPAVIHTDGSEEYYVNGNLHRLDGPAVKWKNGDFAYYKDGVNHRIGGPAIKWANGCEFWYVEGKLHREFGPAVVWSNGAKEYWLNGEMVPSLAFEPVINKVDDNMYIDTNVISLDKYRAKRSKLISK